MDKVRLCYQHNSTSWSVDIALASPLGKGQAEQSTTRASRVARDSVEWTLGLGVEGLAGKGATLQQMECRLRLGHEEQVREQEGHSGEDPHVGAPPTGSCTSQPWCRNQQPEVSPCSWLPLSRAWTHQRSWSFYCFCPVVRTSWVVSLFNQEAHVDYRCSGQLGLEFSAKATTRFSCCWSLCRARTSKSWSYRLRVAFLKLHRLPEIFAPAQQSKTSLHWHQIGFRGAGGGRSPPGPVPSALLPGGEAALGLHIK